MREFDGYLKEDIDELERLKKKIPNDREFSIELINYKEQLMLFSTSLKIAEMDGLINADEAAELKEKYFQY